MVGASVTAGFLDQEPLGGPYTTQLALDRYVDQAIRAPHAPVRNLGTALFFIQPETLGRQQIHDAVQAEPTLVVGLDFLFWYCYGVIEDEPARLRRVDAGLSLIQTLTCPVVMGDIPDGSGARGGMLHEAQIPQPSTLREANRRLRAWAEGRKNVFILPLARFMQQVLSNQPVTIHGITQPAGRTARFLQGDGLHPSPPGCAMLAMSILDTCRSGLSGFPDSQICWEPREVFEKVRRTLPILTNQPPGK